MLETDMVPSVLDTAGSSSPKKASGCLMKIKTFSLLPIAGLNALTPGSEPRG